MTLGFKNGETTTYNFEVATVPEPGTLALLGAGAAALGLLYR